VRPELAHSAGSGGTIFQVYGSIPAGQSKASLRARSSSHVVIRLRELTRLGESAHTTASETLTSGSRASEAGASRTPHPGTTGARRALHAQKWTVQPGDTVAHCAIDNGDVPVSSGTVWSGRGCSAR